MTEKETLLLAGTAKGLFAICRRGRRSLRSFSTNETETENRSDKDERLVDFVVA